MAQTKIEWTDASWNPVTGCTKVSTGCANCYAEKMANRLKAMGNQNYRNGFCVTLQPSMLELPLRWKRPRRIFVNSMSDLFHETIPLDYIKDVFDIISKAPQHIFQILTKRSERLKNLAQQLNWHRNIWVGVTIEHPKFTYRIDDLKNTPAKIKFISCEPLLDSLSDLILDGIDWVIVGGESGNGARPMKQVWVTEIRDKCISMNIPFFFKQWGGVHKRINGRVLEGKVWNEWPK